MGLFIVIIAILGWVAGYFYNTPEMLYVAIAVGCIYALIQYFVADKLAVVVNGAHQIEKRDNPRLYRIVENLAITTGQPVPRVYIMDDPSPNAFASGRDPKHALVCVTTGLLDMMDDTELQAVVAHEFGHIQNYDIRMMMIVFGLVSAIGLISDVLLRMTFFGRNDREDKSPLIMILGIVAIILAPIVATLVQFAVSRRREFLADSTAALTTRYPDGLARALQKISDHGSVTRSQNTATAHLFFANPLKDEGISKLFSTHPPIAERIARLQKMGTKL